MEFEESMKQSDISGRRKMYPKEQWLALRPIIQRLYVDEGQTFLKVAEYLHEHHDFNPTKKQFLRRISEWGIQKNIKRDERRTILDSLGDAVKEVEFEPKTLRGRRLDKAKIARWKKREEMISGESRPGIANRSETSDGELNLRGGDCSRTVETEPCNQDDLVEEIHRQGSQPGPMGGNQAQMFNPWLVVDVIGSPHLTGLIGALTLDLCEEIPDFDLSAPYSGDLEGQFESRNAELDSESIVSEEDNNLQNAPPSVPVDTTALLTAFSRRSRYRIPTPFDELYPFPQFAPKSVFYIPPRTDPLASSCALTKQEIKCRRKFKALKNMAPLEIMDLVEDMQSIAWRHSELNNYHCEEVWWRRVITSSLKIPWHQPLQILYACLNIIENLRFQSRYTEARRLHQDLHPKILKLVRSDHGLATLSGRILASLKAGDYLQAAAWREVLQLCLLQFGPRHRETSICLSGLGSALLNLGQPQEAETIVYINLQLNLEPLNHAKPLQDRFLDMSVLARSLSRQQKFDDCASVLGVIEGLFGPWIGFDDHLCWKYYNIKAKVLKYLGRLLECEDILRGILRHAPDHPGIEASNAMAQLVDLLMETNRLAEAVIWQEKIFLMEAEMYGFGDPFSQTNCENLGFDYANLGRYEDAIIHFQQTAGKVALSMMESTESRDGYIKRIRGWISEVEKMKEGQAKKVELQRNLESMPPDASGLDLD